MNLTELFYAQAAARPDHPLVLGPRDDDAVTYGAFAARVRALGERLAGHGITRGTNVGLHCPSGADYIALTYALWHAGACVTPIPTELAAAEKLAIAEAIHLDALLAAVPGLETLDALIASAPAVLADGCVLAPARPRRAPPAGLAAIDAAFIRFTSGTTGASKGVVLSHRTIAERIVAANAGLRIGPDDRVLWLLSMAYHFAVSIVAYLSFGATIVLCRNHFGVTIVDSVRARAATLLYGAPSHFELMTHDRSGQMISSLRLAIATTARLRPEISEAFYRRFRLAPNETYGIIEVGLPAANIHAPWEKRGSVGPPLPAYELRLHEPGADGIGEIRLRGPGLLDAYYEPWLTREALLDQGGGWLATGDLGRLDGDGCLTIVGRTKELISVAGMKFFPQEVEAVLARHPAVREACVYARADPHLGEVPHALVVLRGADPGTATLAAFCREHLAAYKVPQVIRPVAQIPRTGSGKLVRDGSVLAAVAP